MTPYREADEVEKAEAEAARQTERANKAERSLYRYRRLYSWLPSKTTRDITRLLLLVMFLGVGARTLYSYVMFQKEQAKAISMLPVTTVHAHLPPSNTDGSGLRVWADGVDAGYGFNTSKAGYIQRRTQIASEQHDGVVDVTVLSLDKDALITEVSSDTVVPARGGRVVVSCDVWKQDHTKEEILVAHRLEVEGFIFGQSAAYRPRIFLRENGYTAFLPAYSAIVCRFETIGKLQARAVADIFVSGKVLQ